MQKLFIFLSAVFLIINVWAQAPQKISYQAVIRDNDDALVVNTQVGMQISILQGSISGTVVYTETHTPVTNANGLVTIDIGAGNKSWWNPNFDDIDWSEGPVFVKTETDPEGGTNYTISGTSQILSVPYALHAQTADTFSGPIPETDPVFKTSAAGGITKADTSFWNTKQNQLIAGKGIRISGNVISIDSTKAVDEIGIGIATQYPGDEDIEQHESVIFTENFEAESIAEVVENWTWSEGTGDHRLSLDEVTGPDGSPGSKSLKMTILRDEDGDACGMRKIFDEGHEQLFLRFYAKFAEDYGYNHHFTSLSGALNPTPWPVGSAGNKPVEHFSSAIDQLPKNINLTGTDHSPPGYWMFYSYWPEMRSWQNVDGTTDGRPNPYYGNNFMPNVPVAASRGEWQCIEIMIRLNSSPDLADGAQAFWINGELAGHWDPKEDNPVEGYWIRDKFRHDPDHANAAPFDGIKWRNLEDTERFEELKINIIRIQNYVSGTSWENADRYASEHPEFIINLQEATVWKDHIVVATEYIGPMVPQN
jgi:hypothetical protein